MKESDVTEFNKYFSSFYAKEDDYKCRFTSVFSSWLTAENSFFPSWKAGNMKNVKCLMTEAKSNQAIFLHLIEENSFDLFKQLIIEHNFYPTGNTIYAMYKQGGRFWEYLLNEQRQILVCDLEDVECASAVSRLIKEGKVNWDLADIMFSRTEGYMNLLWEALIGETFSGSPLLYTNDATSLIEFSSLYGHSPLSLDYVIKYAVQRAELIESALKNGFNPNDPDAVQGRSLLEYMANDKYAFGSAREKILQLLLDHGADISLLPKNLQTSIKEEIKNK